MLIWMLGVAVLMIMLVDVPIWVVMVGVGQHVGVKRFPLVVMQQHAPTSTDIEQ